MDRLLAIVCFSFLLIFGLMPLGQAQTSGVFPWPEQLESAEVSVVCLGTVTSTEVSARRHGLAEATVHVSVLRVFKGPVTLKQLTFTEVLEQDEPKQDVPADKYAIFFLSGQADKNWFQLFMPYQSIIALGNGVPKFLSLHLSPFRAISLLMADALADAGEERRFELLAALDEAVMLEITANPGLAKLEQIIGEPHGVKLFYDEQITPLVKPYLRDQNSEVRRVAANIVAHRF